MGSCCSSRGYSVHEEHDERVHVTNVSQEERRRMAAEAADRRQKGQESRGMNGATGQLRNAYSEIPGNIDNNVFKWQTG